MKRFYVLWIERFGYQVLETAGDEKQSRQIAMCIFNSDARKIALALNESELLGSIFPERVHG